jgi:predicted HTH domain antitoxin
LNAMASLNIEIPEEVSRALRLPPDEAEKVLRRELALALYARGILPFGKACLLAGMNVREFTELLGARQITRHYTEEDLQMDLDYAQSSQ